jgi:prevent-host-death family protein
METLNLEANRIGAFEAKTHLSRLLERVQKGNEVIITKRGKPIARLIPFKEDRARVSKDIILDEFARIRQNVKGKVDIKTYIAEGRKH